MKKYTGFVIGLLAALLAGSCDDNYEKIYSGDASLYFNLALSDLDSVSYSFIGQTENKMVADIPVEITGYASAENRPFRIRVNTERTTAVAGKHYEALKDQYVLEKGKYSVMIPVTLLYSGDLDNSSVRLVLDLEGGEGFSAGIPYRQEVTISFSNRVPVIKNWSTIYASYFGDYSAVKHRYILSELKFEKLEDSITFYYEMDRTVWDAYGQFMNNFFAANVINDEHGQRIEPWIQ